MRTYSSLGVLALLGASCVGSDSTTSSSTESQLRGAVFTTTSDGSRVDANIYAAKEDVYLDGGPGPNAPSSAAALPPGDYFFQVTDPSGKDLLSSDHISCRRIRIGASGFIEQAYRGTTYVRSGSSWTATECAHVTGVDDDYGASGAITVQLFPFDDTRNKGGEYKVWVTPVESYTKDPAFVPVGPDDVVNGEGKVHGNAHGFEPSASKTDNFKVRSKTPCEGEDCDDDDDDECGEDHECPTCGDGHVDTGEQCDDGNTTAGDGCSATCTTEPMPEPCCGDGHLDAGEQCDDGNTTSGDGCSATCTTELPEPACGDGHLDTGEECDDGNTTSGDGCDASCKLEHTCPPTSSCPGSDTSDRYPGTMLYSAQR